MTSLRRTALSLTSVAAGALALILAAPRAVHAVAAALVQVTNTVSVPAITQPVASLGSQQVTLECPVNAQSNANPIECLRLGVGGSSAQESWAPPSEFVITSVMITAPTGGGTTLVALSTLAFGLATGVQWIVPGDGLSHSFQTPQGLAWPGGSPLTFYFTNSGNSNGNNAGPFAYVFGYLTSN